MSNKKSQTKAIRNQVKRSEHREHSVPLYLTSSFVFNDAEQARAMFANEIEGNVYSRFSNPNTEEFVDKMCALEEAEDGVATASGMSAVYTSLAGLLDQGDHILVSRAVFGSTHQILTMVLPRFGITYTYADGGDPESWEKLIQPNTKMIFVETPSNPGLDLIDLEWVGELAKKHNLLLNVDNCFATPYLQKPMLLGADIVVHSATKYIDGQGRAIGGVIVGNQDLIDKIRFFARHTGPALSPFNAWLFSKSLETLSIRMEKHSENALELASYLEDHSEVDSVKYPFLASHPQHALAKKQMKMGSGLVVFNVKGGLERGRRFMDSLKMLSLTANLGDTRTIATHPASTTHSKLTEEERNAVSIFPGLIRVSTGLEDMEDIIDDIEQALERSK
ncbi:MAG: aminotransferase class I/II-fold pyridoxal phosphate-dependent enzyme [Balneolales bacterium]